jgi:hypothetical protein
MTPPLFRRVWPALAAAASILLVTGCSTSAYEVKVDSITKPAPGEAQSYTLKSKNPALGEENLRYQEAAGFIKTALSGKGLYEAPSEDRADMIVELDYGMESPRTKTERVSVPVYAQVGGGVRYDTVPVTDVKGNTGYRTVAVYEPPRSELIGYDDMPRQVTIYEKYIRISARENKPAAEGKPPAELWSVQASAEDESKDVRKYLPILASATAEYIGRDSNHQTTIKVKENGDAVDFIRRGLPANSASTVAATPKS